MSEKKNRLDEVLGRIHLQWFADDDDPEMTFVDDEEDDDEEIVILKPGESPPTEEEEEPEVKGESIEELRTRLAQAQAAANQSGQMGEFASQIAEAINQAKPQGQAGPADQKPGESEQEYAARLEKELFKPGQTFKALQEAVFRIMSPAYQEAIGATVEQSKRIMEVHPEYGPKFKKYEKEIEERRAALPYPQRNSPRVYDTLYKQVIADHADEINQETIQEEVQRQVQETLKNMGIETPEGGQPTFTEGGGVRRASGGPKKKRIYITEADRQAALQKGVDVRDYVRRKAQRGA